MKSMITSDLMFLSAWLILTTWLFDDNMNVLMLLLLMGMMICLYKRLLVVMLNLGLGVLEL